MSGQPAAAKLQKTERAQFLVDNLNLPQASGVEDAVWEDFQLQHLNDDSDFRIEDKSRQIAWSFLCACESVAEAVLDARSSIFSSINHDEAREKIRYAKAVYECLEIGGLPKLVIDNQLELGFDNGARLTSFPARPVRGKARSNWYGDEFAHLQHDREIYKGSLPITSKGGRIRIGSSPLGASGLFWEIFTQPEQFRGYKRKVTPWWEVQAFCKKVREARKLAPAMDTEARVELFGKDKIKAIFANLPVEDFQQEYECAFVDETTAWITWEEIQSAQDKKLNCLTAVCRSSKIDKALEAIDQLAESVFRGKIEKVLFGGMDIGRTKHATEIFICGVTTTDTYPLRLMITLDNCDFDSQYEVIEKILSLLPVVKFQMDRTGLGIQLAEKAMKDYPAKAEGVNFTNLSKELWATDAKMLFQQHRVIIPINRDLAYQIHSIKKKVTPSKNVTFDTERNEKHHADKFWAMALMLNGAKQPIIVRKPKRSKSFDTYD